MPSTRRRFLSQLTSHLTGAAVAGAALPDGVRALVREGAESGPLPAGSDVHLLGREGRAPLPGAPTLDALATELSSQEAYSEAYWRVVSGQYPLREDLVLMNAANLCPSPRPVQERVFELTRDVDRDASFQNRGKFGELAEASRQALARLMGADADEVAIVRNTSSANATVVNGLDLGPGDEVVLWDQNHPTNAVAWDVRAEREGFSVVRVSTPPAPTTAAELLAAFEDAITDRTRVVSFSHVSNVSGVGLPAAELCRLAHDRGAFAMIDGAQTFGALEVDLHAIGCDAYTGSAHKWLTGPKEAGLLYVRREWHEALWPTHVGVGWSGARGGGAQKFEVLGQRDDAAVAAVATTVDFHELIGVAQIDARVRQLAGALRDGLTERIPDVRFHTPADPALSGGVVIFALPGVEDYRTAFGRLYEEHGIAGASAGGGFDGVRLCPHIYNTMAQVERAVDAVVAVASA